MFILQKNYLQLFKAKESFEMFVRITLWIFGLIKRVSVDMVIVKCYVNIIVKGYVIHVPLLTFKSFTIPYSNKSVNKVDLLYGISNSFPFHDLMKYHTTKKKNYNI